MRSALSVLVVVSAMSVLAADDAGTASLAEAPRPASGVTVEVTVTNIKVSGRILMSLHAKAETFPGKSDQAYRNEWVKVTSSPFVYRFTGVPPGAYAVGAAQDENDNGKLDTGIFHIPTEPVGVSNNPFSLGPPSFSSARFDVGASDVALSIKLR